MTSSAIAVNLSGQSALVTGASSGIGAAVAEALATNGALVWVNHPDDASADAAAAVVSRITSAGGKAQAIQADVSCEADVLAMFHEIEGAGLDILVNNAGIAHASPVESLEVADFDRLMVFICVVPSCAHGRRCVSCMGKIGSYHHTHRNLPTSVPRDFHITPRPRARSCPLPGVWHWRSAIGPLPQTVSRERP